MFGVESYVTPILLSYVDKYVKDFRPEDAQVSLWAGGVVLHNLVLKADVLQQEVSLPFKLISGRIHELLIQVPWTKIMSEPIVVTIDTIECVLNLRSPDPSEHSSATESPARKPPVVEAPPGYMQALVRRIVSNIVLRVHHLIVKYVEDDIVFSLNVKHLEINSADANWLPAFADIDTNLPVLRRLVRLEDLTLCLDRADSDGKIRYYQEPLLYRCQLNLRVLTRLVSANTRRAIGLSVQVRSSKLAFGVSSDQLGLLLRILRERSNETKPKATASPTATSSAPPPVVAHGSSTKAIEQVPKSESWSDWAWSWLPLADREGPVEEAAAAPAQIPIQFTAFLDVISLVFKTMETENTGRKRARAILEATSEYAAVLGSIRKPTTLQLCFGTRSLTLKSTGKCVCGNFNSSLKEGGIEHMDYLRNRSADTQSESVWSWPEYAFEQKIEFAEAVDEDYKGSEGTGEELNDEEDTGSPDRQSPSQEPDVFCINSDLWQQMAPVLFMTFKHNRTPPLDAASSLATSPYENVPDNFEYSDWDEQVMLNVRVTPLELCVNSSLLHRLMVIWRIFKELPDNHLEVQKRTLTVEEIEALCENLPQRRIHIDCTGLLLRLFPYEHSALEKPMASPMVLDLELPTVNAVITGPLYPQRVASAACQFPEDSGPLWQGTRLHVSVLCEPIQAKLTSMLDKDKAPRPVARVDIKVVFHILLHPELFIERGSVLHSFSVKIKEINVCGSAPRLQAAYQVVKSIIDEKPSAILRYTSLSQDAFADEESVAVDMTVEDTVIKSYVTSNIWSYIIQIQALRATALHAKTEEDPKQAWLLSGPDSPTTQPFVRIAGQWLQVPMSNSLDYIGIWSEPVAFAIDPVFISWLAYKPTLKPVLDLQSTANLSKSISATQYFTRRRTTPPSSSGRGASRTGSASDMVHSARPRSLGSSSEPSEKKDRVLVSKPPKNESWMEGERLHKLYERLKHMLIHVDIGLVLIYMTFATASALDCETVRHAMERHAADSHGVMVYSCGRLFLRCNNEMKHMWQDVHHDGPTYTTGKSIFETDSFPWKMHLSDISCYTLECQSLSERSGKERSASALRTNKLVPVVPMIILEQVTTSVTVSILTKTASLPKRSRGKHEPGPKMTDNKDEDRVKYFSSGMDFKPSTLKEFIRGPASKKTPPQPPAAEQKQDNKSEKVAEESVAEQSAAGPLKTLGINIHADTPPLIVRLDQEQTAVIASSIHCLLHILRLLRRPTLVIPQRVHSSTSFSNKSLIRSVSELEQRSPSDETRSESQSDLVPIFEAREVVEAQSKLKTFFWLQWVVSRATLVVASEAVKVAFDVDDIISTVDLQAHYNQLKVKVASASVKHYERDDSGYWRSGQLGGRILEAREPTDVKEDNHFFSITVTQAQISNLPASWKEELNPKLLQSKNVPESLDTMWEVYATLATLELVVTPTIVEHMISLFREVIPSGYCGVMEVEKATKSTYWQWPYVYVVGGGLRLLLNSEETCDRDSDDTFVLMVSKLEMNPYPENPICRRTVALGSDTTWTPVSGGLEGRQYELYIRNVAIHTAKFEELVDVEISERNLLKKGTGSENPAVKWTQPAVVAHMTTVLYSIDVGCVIAPAMYISGILACGPAIELNLMSDCSVELCLDHVKLAANIGRQISIAIVEGYDLPAALEECLACPYESYLKRGSQVEDTTEQLPPKAAIHVDVEPPKGQVVFSTGADSGVDTSTIYSTSRRVADDPRKSMNVGFADEPVDPSEYLEVFVTMGVIEICLYINDIYDDSLAVLRPPVSSAKKSPDKNDQDENEGEENLSSPDLNDDKNDVSSKHSVSITEMTRKVDLAKSNIELQNLIAIKKVEGVVKLLCVTLQQPNLYYWKKKSQKSVQVSLFNMWVGLGGNQTDDWQQVLLNTSRGVPDPESDIPPALATMKVIVPCSPGSTLPSRGSIRLDLERPVQLEISENTLLRLKAIQKLINEMKPLPLLPHDAKTSSNPFLYNLRKFMVNHSLETVTVQTTQIGITGQEGTAGWESMSFQISTATRPDRVIAKVFVCALLVSIGPPGDRRHSLLHPVMLGLELEAKWDVWRYIETGLSLKEPTIHLLLETDRITLDLKPENITTIVSLIDILEKVLDRTKWYDRSSSATNENMRSNSVPSTESLVDLSEHYYKDDLRSGAFKLLSGGQLPMAYQVRLNGAVVSWRYPHPRAITRIVAFPLPDQDIEIDCVLEHYSYMLGRWEPHFYFKLPVAEQREHKIYVPPPEAQFAVMWRFRVCSEERDILPPHHFSADRFLPKHDSVTWEPPNVDSETNQPESGVTAEQLSGILRVDSYFAPRLLPRMRILVRSSAFEIHLHNSLPSHRSDRSSMDGYYLTKPLMKSHRVLTLTSRHTTAHIQFSPIAGYLMLLRANLSTDILDCDTGTIEPLIDETRAYVALSVPGSAWFNARLRYRTSPIRVALQIPRFRTIQTLAEQWRRVFVSVKQRRNSRKKSVKIDERKTSEMDFDDSVSKELEGLVSLWVQNTCTLALRVGQEATDQLVTVGPGSKLAFRWRCPVSAKNLRFSCLGTSTDWHWSTSIPFSTGSYRVKLPNSEELGSSEESSPNSVNLYIKVEECGQGKTMQLMGRLTLGNMLRYNLLFKVRSKSGQNSWRTVSSGDLNAESTSRTVLCSNDNDMVLKVKFAHHDSGWSGDIPLKECPKENVPWLVKVPSEGDVPYMSVWCRVIKARSDGRIVATIWPLYMLLSNLPLDTDVLISSDTSNSSQTNLSSMENKSPPLVQSASGRGHRTHLMAPGTTAVRHNLTFQYRNLDCPVTREAVPLHYGVTDVSVFDKRPVVNNVDEVLTDIEEWLKSSGRNIRSSWPYSTVTKHWPEEWKSALLQPRSDVTVRYAGVKAGGGCCLELQLCPVVLLCNACPIALTLRAYDAAPICKLEPGNAISPPSSVLKRPFFMSLEIGRETFVSSELEVWGKEPGPYGTPPPGRVALHHPAPFAIHCNQKVALLTLYYEIKEDINVLGISCTYVFINRLDINILVSSIAVPNESDKDVVLQPKSYVLVTPMTEESVHGTQLCRFSLQSRWRGGDVSELCPYLGLALPADDGPAAHPVPIRLAADPARRAISLLDQDKRSIPVVVTQQRLEGRCVVTVSRDPCPQLLVANRTRLPLVLGQPVTSPNEPSTSKITCFQECPGIHWNCTVEPNCEIHYSTPAYCARFPPNTNLKQQTFTCISIAKVKAEDEEYQWCAPVAAADGEQLVQLAGSTTIKLRVHPHPHSTLFELQDVDQNDISASDIRRRLMDPDEQTCLNLERVGGNDKLIEMTRSVSEIQDSAFLTCSRLAGKESGFELRSSDNNDMEDDQEEYLHKTERATSSITLASTTMLSPTCSYVFNDTQDSEWHCDWSRMERLRGTFDGFVIELGTTPDSNPLLAIHVDRVTLYLHSDKKGTSTTVSIADVQIDNLQYDSGQFDFAVVASTRSTAKEAEQWPTLWTMFSNKSSFSTRQDEARIVLNARHDKWVVLNEEFSELSELDVSVGPLALYVEDAYVTALIDLCRRALPSSDGNEVAHFLAETRALVRPLRLHTLHIHPLDLTLTLHTAVRMYIALDQSPLRLTAFKLQNMMTSAERLTHALTVHYLSAAILGAGWVVGGLELLGAPGALAARVGGASGGVRGVASAAAAALLRSLSAWAGSLARNLDLLAGDEEHIRRAAAARRRPPQSFIAGLTAGITNFAINILGAVGGLAHHPVVGVAVGETDSSTAALRRSLLGALTKPLSATADLVAYAGHGLLTQTGWDPVPQPRAMPPLARPTPGWRRDCVRWTFRLAELCALAGYEIMLDNTHVQILLTHKFFIIADPVSEKIVEMIDFKFCTLGPLQGSVIELYVKQGRPPKVESKAVGEDDEYQANAAAMARVARYTGAAGSAAAEARVLTPPPAHAHSLHAALAALIHHNAGTHLHLM